MNENEYPENPNPYLKSSLIEKLTFSWIGNLLSLGRKKQLDLTDLNSKFINEFLNMIWFLNLKIKKKGPLPQDDAKILTDQLEMFFFNFFIGKLELASWQIFIKILIPSFFSPNL